GGRELFPPTSAAHLLPRRCDRARVADQDSGLQRADIDAELERIRRDDAAHRPVAQAALDRASFGWEVPAAIAAHKIWRPLRLREPRAEIGEQQLRRYARAGERDRLDARREERRRDVASGEERALTDAKRRVDDRRVDEH